MNDPLAALSFLENLISTKTSATWQEFQQAAQAFRAVRHQLEIPPVAAATGPEISVLPDPVKE